MKEENELESDLNKGKNNADNKDLNNLPEGLDQKIESVYELNWSWQYQNQNNLKLWT